MALSLPTWQDIYNAAKAEILARNPALTDFTDGSVLDALTGAMAMAADEALAIVIDRFTALFIDTAEEDALDALIADRFPDMEPRIEETASIGILRITRGGSVGVLTIPAGTQVRGTVDGVTVTVATNASTDMLGPESYVDVTATCTATGPSGNVAAGVLTAFVSALSGDSTATVTNPDRFVGGAEEEGDPSLRSRAKLYYATIRRGTIDALKTGARSVGGVRYVTVDESTVATAGTVGLYVGDPDGTGNATLAALVDAEIINWRAAGVLVAVVGSEREEIALALTVYCDGSVDTTVLTDDLRAAVFGYTDNIDSGATLYLNQVTAAAIPVSPSIRNVVVTSPLADVTPSNAYSALRVAPADLSISYIVG